MKNIRLILLYTATIIFAGSGKGYAQTTSSVLITATSKPRKITLQVIDNDNKVSLQEFKPSEETPLQLYLKQEMDKWINDGYNLQESYGYVVTSPTGAVAIHEQFETIILTKKE